MYYGEAMERHSANLCEKLRERIRSYKVAHPGLSSSQIAKSFNISSSAFGRLENGDIRFPSLDLVLRVLRGTGCKNILQYLEEYFPEIAKTYKEVYLSNGESQYVDLSLEKYFEDPDLFIYMLLSYSDSGFSRVEVEELFGLTGVMAIEYLKKNNAIVERNGIFFGSDKFSVMSGKSIKKLAINTLETCHEPTSDSSFLVYSSQSIDLKKVNKEITALLRETHTKMQQILNDKNNFGDDHYYFLMSAGRILKGIGEEA
ncbi:hypothetical protein M899_1450 [Bacteriovorax sp. BSW11_IV]|uniref:helix-turn-helix domain-containing protein n=1 Tax=Bacteriovorax sp. BSW11_IV TaxID=1353529 RepID=UPI00038A3CF5|nr:helix-turn-helix transcriptional regulator [Bacteriovorax sp. BSW11_IV]EQC48340.1 hypothetical protein M899_1450 [Bacteriovorax sp. BSW11_IV]